MPCEFIVYDNGSEDGTSDWLEKNKINHIKGEKNLGVGAVNFAAARAKYDYVVDVNADMFFLPGWDIAFFKQIQKFKADKIDKFFISSRLIEPIGNNPEYQIFNCGTDWSTFDEKKLLEFYSVLQSRHEQTNQYSHPICLSKKMWNDFGGVDMRYEWGMATDHDLPAEAYRVGCRYFVELANPTVFHFSSKTISKLPRNKPDGQKTFLDKWGITVDEFRRRMKIGQKYQKVEDGVFG